MSGYTGQLLISQTLNIMKKNKKNIQSDLQRFQKFQIKVSIAQIKGGGRGLWRWWWNWWSMVLNQPSRLRTCKNIKLMNYFVSFWVFFPGVGISCYAWIPGNFLPKLKLMSSHLFFLLFHFCILSSQFSFQISFQFRKPICTVDDSSI